MLLGFRMLEEALQHKQSEAYELVITWAKLFLVSENKKIIVLFKKIQVSHFYTLLENSV